MLNNLDCYFYIEKDIFNKIYQTDLDFGSYILIHTDMSSYFLVIEYNRFMIERLIKIYKITKNKKLKKLHDFILFCDKHKIMEIF